MTKRAPFDKRKSPICSFFVQGGRCLCIWKLPLNWTDKDFDIRGHFLLSDGLMQTHKTLYLLGLLCSSTIAQSAEITSNKNQSGQVVIQLTGEIKSGDEERFRALSLQHPKAVVQLQSPGGALAPALEIGRIIRIAGYSTVVLQNDTCVSACALIWLGGRVRYLDGRVGFHAAYRDNEGLLQESGAANALIGNYMTLLGLPSKAVVFATAAPPDKVLWLDAANKELSGIDFELPLQQPPLKMAPTAPVLSIPPPSPLSPRSFPNDDVVIIDAKELELAGARHVDYTFRYRGFLLRRYLEEPENPKKELKEFIDRQIKEEDGWLFYGTSGEGKSGDFIFYYLNVDSLTRKNSVVNVWVKENHKYNKFVRHREDIIFYKIYCSSRELSILEISSLNASGSIIKREYFDDVKERLIPGRMDEALWETVC